MDNERTRRCRIPFRQGGDPCVITSRGREGLTLGLISPSLGGSDDTSRYSCSNTHGIGTTMRYWDDGGEHRSTRSINVFVLDHELTDAIFGRVRDRSRRSIGGWRIGRERFDIIASGEYPDSRLFVPLLTSIFGTDVVSHSALERSSRSR